VRAARPVAEQFQSLPVAAQAIIHEPRLVRVGAARDSSEALEPERSRLAAKGALPKVTSHDVGGAVNAATQGMDPIPAVALFKSNPLNTGMSLP